MSENSETISDIEYCLNKKLSTIRPNEIQRRQNFGYIKKIFGRFDCENCGRWWRSAFNTINVKLIYNPANQKIKILELNKSDFGQACQNCDDKIFYKPSFDVKSVAEDILKHLLEAEVFFWLFVFTKKTFPYSKFFPNFYIF